VEAQRAVRRCVDDLDGEDHRHVGEHVELGAERAVLLHQVGDRLPLAAKARVAEERDPAVLRLGGQGIGPPALGRCVGADDLVSRVEQPHQHVAPEGRLTEDRDAERHGRRR
jgi:hypothetical protein